MGEPISRGTPPIPASDHISPPPQGRTPPPDARLRMTGWVAAVTTAVAEVLLLGLLALVVLDVSLRVVRDRGIDGALEVATFTLVCTIFFGMFTAAVDGQHVTSTILTSKLSAVWELRAQALGQVAACVTSLLLTIATWERAVRSYQDDEHYLGVVSVPVWPARASITLGLLLLTLFTAGRLVVLARRLRARQYADTRADGSGAPGV